MSAGVSEGSSLSWLTIMLALFADPNKGSELNGQDFLLPS